ncbi:Checkpoint kinase 2, partial [Actinomortierella ambigua]
MSSGTFRIPAEPNRQRPRSPGTADASTSSGNGNSQQQSGANSSLLPLPPPLSPPQQQQQQHQQQGQQTQQHEPENANASLSRSSREPLTEVSGSQAQGSTSWSSSSHAGEGHDYSQELRDGMTEYRHPSKGKGVVGGGEGEGGQATQLPTQLDPTQVIGLDPTQVIGLDLTQLGDDDEEDQNDEGIPFATLIGQDGLADVILRDKMQEMTFGASHECDVQLRPRKLGLCPTGNKLRLPWFRLTIKRHENRHSRIPTQPSVYIEDLNGFGTYLDDRLVTKPQLVQWGVHIQGSPNGAKNYFQYLFRSNKKDDAPFEVEGKEATYRVFEPFGEGQYSTVWKAVNVDDDKQVYACKDMDKHRRDFNPIELACMKQEVKILKSLKHENIIKFVDEAEVENHIYIFTEYVCGYTLDDIFIRLGNYIDEPTCRKIIKQVCKALCYLHSISIVHRDIKSE